MIGIVARTFYTRKRPFREDAVATPTYTSTSLAGPKIADSPTTEVAAHGRLDRIDRWLARLRTNRRLIQATLDLIGIGLVAGAFVSPLMTPELWFHWVFVILTLQAFLFGLRHTMIRIAIASVPLLVYANASRFGLAVAEIELTEWPLMFVIAGIVAWMADRRETTAQRYASLYRRASERLLTVQEDERRRIARELHDGVGQALTAIILTLDSQPDGADEETRRAERLASRHAARRMADMALAETRHLGERLRPARLDEIGLVHALQDLARRAGFHVEIVAAPDATASDLLSPSARVEVYRIVQEALANAARHSAATGARVTVTRDQHRLFVEVADDGVGFEPLAVRESGIGLAGMHERAELLNANLRITSAPGRGTRVSLDVPLAPMSAGALT